ncbi:hypothetical protein SK128_011321, partial [Halocaridina rubra]
NPKIANVLCVGNWHEIAAVGVKVLHDRMIHMTVNFPLTIHRTMFINQKMTSTT